MTTRNPLYDANRLIAQIHSAPTLTKLRKLEALINLYMPERVDIEGAKEVQDVQPKLS